MKPFGQNGNKLPVWIGAIVLLAAIALLAYLQSIGAMPAPTLPPPTRLEEEFINETKIDWNYIVAFGLIIILFLAHKLYGGGTKK